MPADLHIHTCFSDSTLSPGAVVEEACRQGLSTIAITDHDTTDGISEAIYWGEQSGLSIIPGVELSTNTFKREVHILGYFIDLNSEVLQTHLRVFRETRYKRAQKIVEKLAKLGQRISFERIKELSGRGCIGRLHVATVMCEAEIVDSKAEAFQYIGQHGPCYVPKHHISPAQAIRIILDAGGIPVLAHPYTLNYDEIIPQLVSEGLMGLEVYHTEHPPAIEKHYCHLAQKYGLLITGGSDCHGMGKGRIMIGERVVSDEMVDRLRKCGMRNAKCEINQ